jgi:hypothetical protein
VAGESNTTIKISPIFRIFASNAAPTLSSISNRSVLFNSSAIEVPIVLTDADSQLVCGAAIDAKSENEFLLPNRNIIVGGSPPNCKITLFPNQNISGISLVTVLATDGSLTAQSSFSLEVRGPSSEAISSSILPAAGSAVGNNAFMSGTCGEDLTISITGDELLGSPLATTCDSGGSFSLPLSFAGTDGSKTITIKETTSTGQQRQSTRVYLRDATPPQVNIGSLTADQIRNGSEANFTVSFSDASGVGSVDNMIVTITPTLGAACSSRVAGSGVGPYTVTLSSCIGDGTVTITATTGAAADSIGNSSPSITATRSLIVDNTRPTTFFSAPSSAYVTQSSSATWSVTFSDANEITTNASKILLEHTGTASCTKAVSGLGTALDPFVVTVSLCSGDGTVGVSVGAGGARDTAGNESTLASSSQTILVVNTPLSFADANPTVLSGEPFTVSASNSTPPPFASYTLSNGGTFSLLTSLFSSAAGSQPFKTILSLVDSGFRGGNAEISVKGFVQKADVAMPLQANGAGTAFGIVYFNGAYYAGATLENGLYYDNQAVHRISPSGDEVVLVDNNQRYGEIHSMSLISTGTSLLHCSYEWESGYWGSQWTVRRSVDGNNWTTTDRHGSLVPNGTLTTAYDHVCYDIASSPTTPGRVMAVGNDTEPMMGALLRESSDDGLTWSTSATFSDSAYAIAVDVASDDSVWVITTTTWLNGNYQLRKGTKSGSSWSWTATQVGVAGQSCASLYEHYGDLRIIDNNTAVFSGCFSNKWLIKRTTDGGQTWATVYTDPLNVGGGGTIAKLSNGSLIATGRSSSGTYTAKILRSTDNGETWTSVYQNSLSQFEATAVAAGAGSEVMVLATGKSNDIQVLRSTDAGGNWTLVNRYMLEQDYSQLTGVVSDTAGSLWAWSDWLPPIKPGERDPWVLLKSSDRGITWQSIIDKNPSFDQSVSRIVTTPDGSVYVLGQFNNENVIRKSSDGGLSWTTVLVVESSISFWTLDIVAGKDNTIYLSSNVGTKAGTLGGTIWSDVAAITPPDGTFTSRASLSLNDGSLLKIGFINTTNSTSADFVAYRSVNQGSSWSEWYRLANFAPDANVSSFAARAWATQDSAGKIYLVASSSSALTDRIFRSTSDMGSTWNDELLPSVSISSLLTDSSDRLYAVTGATQIYARAKQTGEWFLVSNESSNPADIYEQDYSPEVIRCLDTICVFGGFSKVGLGNRKILRMLESPP